MRSLYILYILLILVSLLATVRPQDAPSVIPTASPTSFSPTPLPSPLPTSAAPSPQPSPQPSQPSTAPTPVPSAPTAEPTPIPSPDPSPQPSITPTAAPTDSPTASPTAVNSQSPSASPSAAPTDSPTAAPTASPSASPTASPTDSPTLSPTASPTTTPTTTITLTPSSPPTPAPSFCPGCPTPAPSPAPTIAVIPDAAATATTTFSLPTFWLVFGIVGVVAASVFVVYRFLYPQHFAPITEPIAGVKAYLFASMREPICPPSLFTAFLAAQASAMVCLIIGAVYLTGTAKNPIEFCFVGVLLLGLSLCDVVATAAAFEMIPINYRYASGLTLYLVLASTYTIFGSQTKDPGALGCGIVLLLLAPAYAVVHFMKPASAASDFQGLLDAPYQDLKTEHGGAGPEAAAAYSNQQQTATYV